MPTLPNSKPNFVLFITDQQRAPQHFPAAWVQANLHNLNELTRHGLTFSNAIINAARCSPSRGVLATGLYAPKNQLTVVGGTLPSQWTTLGAVMQDLGYQVAYLGKWHMTSDFFDASLTVPNPDALLRGERALLQNQYGTPGWDAPDAGTALSWEPATPPTKRPTVSDPFVSTSNTLGGGPHSYTRNDARIAEDAINFLNDIPTNSARPFFLVVSLVNPHDVWTNLYADLMQQAYPEFPEAFDKLPHADQFSLPPSYAADDLASKPQIQAEIRDSYTQQWLQGNPQQDSNITKLERKDALLYLKFYAYLTYLADQQLGRVYAKLKTLPQFTDTLVLRLADHGEMGMAHGGSMEKDCNVYAETLDIPFIFSNPKMFPHPLSCQTQIGLVDVIPTLRGLLGQKPAPEQFQGSDRSAQVFDPKATSDNNCSIFSYDDDYPWCIRAVQAAAGAVLVNGKPTERAYKYAVYFQYLNGSVDTANLQFELYEPGQYGEIRNLQPDHPQLQTALHTLLSERMAAIDLNGPQGGGTLTPNGWPSSFPPPKQTLAG